MRVESYRNVREKIVNVEQLPKGTGCAYLLCLAAERNKGGIVEEIFIAKQWKRKLPLEIADYEMIVEF